MPDPLPPSDVSFRDALDAASIRAWQWDIATQRVDWSPGLEELFGLPPGSFERTFAAYLAVIPPEDRPQVTAAIEGALERGEGYEIEHRVIVASGEVRWVACRGHVIHDRTGKATGMAGVVWDVTRRRHAEEEGRAAAEALRRSEERFRAVVENGIDCIVLVDEAGKIIYASPATGRVLGFTTEELIGRIGRDFVHPDDLPAALAVRESAPGSSHPGALRLRHKDGTYRWLEGSATNLLHDPAVRAIVSNRHDVTERRAAEDQLRFHDAVLAQVNEAVIAADVTGRICYWNEAAERLYGYPAAEAIGQDGTLLLKTVWCNPADATGHRDALRALGSWRGEMIHTTKAGAQIVVEMSIRLLRDESGRPVAGINVAQDVTAKRKLEDQLRHAQKMEAIGVLAGGVAHDFNNLLGVILGFSELPLQGLPPEHPDAMALREVVAAAHRGAELTRKLLAFSRKQIMRLAPLDLNDAIGEAAKLLTRIVGEDVEFVVRRASAPLVIRADAVQIEQILFNLCTNARQAMPRGGQVLIEARPVTVDEAFVKRHGWARVGRFAELAVTDTGVGMDAPTLARIFEPFFTTKERGTGLGLATVYGIVEQHGGAVHAESTPGRGSTLRVHFPIDEHLAAEDVVRRAEPVAPGGSEIVLVAEDAAPLRALVTATLRGLGYTVIAAEDGEHAVREFERRSREIALVVLDVVMPKLGALGAYERMRAIRPDVKVLFTTGYAPEATHLAELLDGQRLRLLEKPFSSRALGLCVRQVIDA